MYGLSCVNIWIRNGIHHHNNYEVFMMQFLDQPNTSNKFTITITFPLDLQLDVMKTSFIIIQ